MNVTLFQDTYSNGFQNIPIQEAFNRIKSGQNLKHISKLRQAHSIGDKKAKAYIKKNDLWSVTFAGIFDRRKAEFLKESTELAIIDIDHVNDPDFYKSYIFNNFYTCFAAWISPSGDGVKVLMRIPKVRDDKEYKTYYNSILKELDDASTDEGTKDISRLCFESYDPNLLQREWDKTSTWENTLTENIEQVKPIAFESKQVFNTSKIYDTADRMIQNAQEGKKRFVLLKASRLIGGYVGSGIIEENEAIIFLETSIQNKEIESFEVAQKAIRSGLNYGKLSPIAYDFREQYTPPESDIEAFPIEIFPPMYVNLINNLEKNLNFPKDYTATAILYAYSVLMGNRFRVKVKNGYETPPACWFGIVGEPGVTKSHPINKILSPIKDWDFISFKKYKIELAAWEQVENNKEPKPMFRKHLVDDFTMEALVKIVQANTNGVGIYADELASWVNNLDRYSNSSNMPKFLSIFDNGGLNIDRKTLDPEVVENVFLSIIGTIQPNVLVELFDKYSSNGFIDRFMFAYPNAIMKPLPLDDIEIPELIEHEEYINGFIHGTSSLENYTYKFENQKDFHDINVWLVDKAQDENTNGRMVNYISKLIGYIPRVAIIIETINEMVVNGHLPTVITHDSMVKTKQIIGYFFSSAEKVLGVFNKNEEAEVVTNGLKYKWEKVIAMRNDGFSFKEVAKKLNISEQVAKNYVQKHKK